ncbi:hypothetical protein EVAR_31315_1 [Eumeta japonica]|uniref:Uncharacterized protein n=1 Tax=Eumeta variegata TaxID=151549 RepID=A0A4C1VRN3_EUMVA|nr:hypothetical protein EVAR_31315_1 [Eumeta japonica]
MCLCSEINNPEKMSPFPSLFSRKLYAAHSLREHLVISAFGPQRRVRGGDVCDTIGCPRNRKGLSRWLRMGAG